MTTAVQSDSERKVLEDVPRKLYIGGKWRDGAEGGAIEVEDPATGETLVEVADGTPGDALAALAAAHERQPEGRAHAPRERGEILRRAYELMVERKEELALLMTLEMGKSVKESETEVAYAAEFFR